ncbi:MAG: hypothetical protein PWQ12_1228 [Clostridiales bacterium]|jgi:uncharacterized integral membrane protein (TIGR00698 family)|nr:hypothetical protein [Clostridiales bacterium]
MNQKVRGILLSLVLALVGWQIGKQFPIIGGPVSSMLLGMLVGGILEMFSVNRDALKPGIQFTSKKILQLAIILLGFEMNLFRVFEVGRQALWIMVFTLSTAFIVAYVMGRALKLDGKMTTLIGVGTSICGGSAIAATAPVIRANDEEVAHAISTIFLFNVLAALIFPALGRMIGLTDTGFGMWAGTAVNDTSSVVAAATTWSEYAGNNTALTLATIVKLTRTLMIIPITLFLSIYTNRKAKLACNGEVDEEPHYSALKIFPWFVLGFVLAALINTAFSLPVVLSGNLVKLGKFMIAMAMAAIGFNTNLPKLIRNGLKPISVGLVCWFTVAVVSLLVQKGLALW